MKPGLYLRVVGDVNDGDYIEEWSNITHLTREAMNEIIEDLVNVKNHGESIDELDENTKSYLPSMDNEEVHSIESVEVVEITYVKEY